MSRIIRLLGGILIASSSLFQANAQVQGGQSAFEYLRMSNNPHVTALGGYVPASLDNDVSFALQNPALLRPAMHNQLSVNYNIYYAGIGIANMQYGYHVAPLNTDFGFGVQYLNYGSFTNTDAQGNNLGDIRATDYSLNFTASRKYLTKWRYGATLKFAQSFLGDASSIALVADVGISYEDTANLWNIGIVAKNMGIQLKQYNPSNDMEPLPFDLQIGISKQLKNVPLRLYLVGHNLYEWDVYYNNPADKVTTTLIGGNADTATGSGTMDKIFRHLNFGAELIIAKRLTVSAAYNHMRRGELGVQNATGTAGFSFGAGINLNKMTVRYARSYYSSAGAYNELGLSFQLNKFFGVGKKTEAWGWDKTYE